jgi:hypothetical protein
LAPLREAQFRNPSVRDFIQRVESPSKKSGRESILLLVADGRELRARLQPALSETGEVRVERYERVGYTSAYGTVQFAPETVQSLETVVKKHAGFSQVNSIFGEGPSPRLRKLRTGLKLLGFDPENLLRHNQHRLIYGVPLADDAFQFLRGEGGKLPDYIKRPGRYRDATERIAAFWTRRWLASRINHTPAIESLAHTPAWKLSDQIPVASSASETTQSLKELRPVAEVAERIATGHLRVSRPCRRRLGTSGGRARTGRTHLNGKAQHGQHK